jgi:hypothetical protein
MDISTEKPEEIVMDGSIDSVANSLLASSNSAPKEAQLDEDATEDNEVEQPEEEEVEEVESDEDVTEDDTDDADDESGEDEADTEDANYQELISVKVDGQEMKVTLDDLKRSYSGQAYIQKGMQDAANQKKEAEQVYQALLNDRQQLSELLQQMQSGDMLQAPVPPTRELFKRDPVKYMDEKLAYDEAKAEYDKQQAQLAQVQQQQNYNMQQAQQVYLQQEMQKLSEKIPEIADPKKGQKFKQDLVDYGMLVGYTTEELNSVMDHRAILVLDKARKYDALQASKPKAQAKVKSAKPMVKAGAKKSRTADSVKKRQEVANRMRNTGSIDDVASFLIS